MRGGPELRVLVECDTGLGRVGVATPEAAAALASGIARTDGLRFAGFLTYPSREGALAFLGEAERLAREEGLEVETVSAGGRRPCGSRAGFATVTEYRVGTYAFHDRATVAAGAATLDEVALTVHATVVSRPAADRAVLDSGSKAFAQDPGPGAASGRSSRRRRRGSSG